MIEVPDIMIAKAGAWSSLRGGAVAKDGFKNFNAGCGVAKDGNWHVLNQMEKLYIRKARYINAAYNQAINIVSGWLGTNGSPGNLSIVSRRWTYSSNWSEQFLFIKILNPELISGKSVTISRFTELKSNRLESMLWSTAAALKFEPGVLSSENFAALLEYYRNDSLKHIRQIIPADDYGGLTTLTVFEDDNPYFICMPTTEIPGTGYYTSDFEQSGNVCTVDGVDIPVEFY